MQLTENKIRQIIRESILDSIKNYLGFGEKKLDTYLGPGPNFKPPFEFKEKTGIDVIGRYKFPVPFNDYDDLGNFLKKNILSDFPEEPEKYANIMTPIYEEMINLNPELGGIIDISGSPNTGQNSKILDILDGAASAFKVQDIAPFVLGTIDRRNSLNYANIIKEKTGTAPGWLMSRATYEETMSQL